MVDLTNSQRETLRKLPNFFAKASFLVNVRKARDFSEAGRVLRTVRNAPLNDSESAMKDQATLSVAAQAEQVQAYELMESRGLA